MYFTFSNHSLQRREHMEPRDKSELLDWMLYIERTVDFKKAAIGNTCKVHSGGSQVIFERKNETRIHVITFIGFKDKSKRDSMKFKMRDIQEKQDTRVAATIDGTTKVCGKFGEDEQGKFLKIRDRISETFDIGTYETVFRYKEPEDLDWLISKDTHGRWRLKDFPKREAVKRTNFKGKTVNCASFSEDGEGKFLRLKPDLLKKFEMGIEDPIVRYEEISELGHLIERDENGEWTLMEFPRINQF